MENTSIAVPTRATSHLMPALTIDEVIERRNIMVAFVRQAMTRDVDYGTIEGTERRDRNGNKAPNDTLLKPGAEKLCTLFGLAPRFVLEEKVEDWTGEQHGGEPLFYYRYKCQLYRDDRFYGESEGSCGSWEKKYRYRDAERTCPNCGKPAIRKSKNAGEGFYCWSKLGGCGAKFDENAPAIVSQQAGKVANPDIADTINTIQKMAQKRALVAAVLVTVNASEFFTQDLDDMAGDAQYKVVTSEQSVRVVDAATGEVRAATERPTPAPVTNSNAAYTKRHVPMSPVQRQKITELWQQIHPNDDLSGTENLARAFRETYNVAMGDATYEQGARFTGMLLADLRKHTTGTN